MANPIQKNDLITDEALSALTTMSTTLSTIAENLTKAKAACQGWGEEEKKTAAATGDNVEELSKMAARITQLEDAIKKLNAAEKENENARRSVNEQKRLYRKLTDDEIKSVEDLKRALQGSVDEQMKAVNAIEVEKKSYNELNQVYNALKDTLNKMTTAQRQNTDAGKAMTAQASKVYETMNQLQQATGKYTLQVGKYRAAFDGLGYSFQQILREAPSALNLNQFFLAISNNIPQFLDQLKAFNAEQKAIKDNLANMTEGTKEYAEEMGKVMSVGQKLSKTLLSWQTGVLVLLMVLRNLPKIIEWFKKLTGATKDWFNALNESRKEQARIMSSVESTLMQTRSELELIINDLKETTQGTVEWKNAIARVNEITKSNLNDTTATIGEVEKVTNAYLEQQKQLEINKKVAEAYAKQQLKEYALKNMFMPGSDWETLLDWTGMSDDKIKQLKELFSKQQKKIDKAIATGADYIPSLYDALLGDRKNVGHDNALKIWTTYGENVSASGQRLRQMYNDLYKSMPAGSSGSGKGKEEKYKYEEVPDRWWDAEKALIRKMKEGYDEEIALQQLAHEKAKSELVDWLTDRENALYSNLMTDAMKMANGDKNKAYEIYNAIISKDEQTVATMSEDVQSMYGSFWYNIEEGQRQHDLIMQGLIIDNNEAIKAINQKYDKQQMDTIQEQYKAEMKVVARRSRTVTQEQQRNAGLIYNINVLRQEIEALTNAQYKDNDSKEEAAKRVETLNKEIEKLRKKMQFDKELSLPGSFWELLQKKGAFDASPDTMKKIVGKFLPDMVGEMDEEQIEDAFKKITENIGTATKEWYNTTIGYVQELINAYVELANAKAEAAKEATEAAQEEYEKEKALLEAGYASRVEATWAEYQEKKAAQEKAEADAKAAAQREKDINEALTIGNLISASAKIWEAFAAWPPVAITALATMWGSFAAAKIKAAEVSKYGEGDVQLVGGGSHASGHDTLLGYSLQGKEMRVENGEVVGIIPRRSVKRLGEQNVLNTMRALRDGTFEANTIKRMSIERNVGMSVLNVPRTDLHKVESGIDKIVALGSRSIHHNPDGTVVETRKNARIVYKNI